MLGGHAGRASAAEPTPGYPEAVIQWGVQKGETCDQIAKVVYGSAKHARLLHRYNRVVCARGAALPEGLTLVLPAAVTDIPDARIRGAQPEVRARPPGAAWVTATSGMPLRTNSSVNTLDEGRAGIEFVDRTRIFLEPSTLVVIYGTASRSRVSREVPAAVELETGEVKSALAALRGGTAEVAIKGGGRVSAASRDTVVQRKGERTTVAVFDGKASVTAAGKSVSVPRNFGTRFVGATPPVPPRPLPPAPAWAGGAPSGAAEIALAPGGEGVVAASWLAVPDAISYRVEVARDPEFNDLVAREEVPPTILSFRGEKLPARTYHMRVRAVDREEYLGIGATRAFHLVSADLGATGQLGARELEANPYGYLDLKPSPALEMALDDGPFGPMVARVDLKQRRPAAIGLRARGAGAAGDQAGGDAAAGMVSVRIRYTTVEAAIAAEKAAGGRAVEVRVTLSGLAGVDVAARVAPALRAHLPGGVRALPLRAAAGGAFAATVPLAGRVDRVRLDVVDDRGGVLGTTEVDLADRAPPPPPPRAAPMPVLGAFAPLLTLSPVTDTLWLPPTLPNAASAGAGAWRSERGWAAQGQARVTGSVGPVGLDAALRSGAAGEPSLGSSGWLGARVRVLRIGRAELELAPALRLGLPLAEAGPPPQLEPSIAVGRAVGRASWVANAGARVRLEDDGGAAGVPTAQGFVLTGATFEPVRWLRAHAALDAHLIHQDEAGLAVIGGLGAGLEAGGAVFGGLSFRVGTTNDEREGTVAGQLTVGIREAQTRP